MARIRRAGVAAALISSLLLAGSAGGVAAAGSPKAQFSFTICQTSVANYDPDTGDYLGQIPAIEMLYAWSGAFVDNVQGSWTRTDGEPVLFGFVDSDFPAGTSGSVDAGSLTVLDDPGFDGLVGVFAVHRHVLATQNIPEPSGGWTAVTACA